MWVLVNIGLAAGLDADGASLPVSDGSVGHPALFAAPPQLAGRHGAVGLRTTLALAPLVRRADGLPSETLVGTSNTVYLQGVGMVTPWLGARVHVPARLFGSHGTGAALGDLRASAVVRVVHSKGVTLAADLGLQLPTGSVARYTSAGRWIPQVGLAGTVRAGPLRVDARAAGGHEGSIDAANARGGITVDAGLGVAVVSSRVGVGIAARTEAPLADEVRRRRNIGTELAVHGDLRVTERVQIDALVGHALTNAAGVPVWRFGVGGTVVFGATPRPLSPPTGRGPTIKAFVDPTGSPVSGAVVTLHDGTEANADALGIVELQPTARSGTVRAPGLEPTEFRANGSVVTLPWATTPVVVDVTTETGETVDATVTGPGLRFARDGALSATRVPPGTYEITVTAEGFGRQTRTVEVAPRRTSTVKVEVVLSAVRGDGSLQLSVVDPQGVAIEGAEVRVDGVALGTSASGAVGLDGLPRQTVGVEVDAPYYEEFRGSVDLTSGRGQMLISPYYAPGTVRVVGTGPSGPIVDGTVYLDGPRSQPAVALSPLGERLIRLTEGAWDVMLSSPSYGLQERRVVLDSHSPVPVDVLFELGQAVRGDADLVVRLRDRDGRPLPGVSLEVDGVTIGTTSTDGSAKLFELASGPTVVTASGRALRTTERSVELQEGVQEVTLSMDWDPGSVQVRASTATGPADALVQFDGPTAFEGGRLGPPGQRLFQAVPTGRWELVASHEAGMEVAVTVVEEDDPHLVDVDLHLGREVGDATLQVALVSPEGDPVSGATVAIDGEPIATTSSGGAVRVAGLVAGTRILTVDSPLHESQRMPIELPGAPVRLTLPYRVGVVDLVVTAGGAPVDDAAVFFDGPRSVDSLALGSDGEARIALGPGSWTLMVSSPRHGLAEQIVPLQPGRRAPTEVQIELADRAPLLVRVTDGRGSPIQGVLVQVDGVDAGRTSTGGVVRVQRSGASLITLSDDRLLKLPERRTPAEVNEQLFEVAWRPRVVAIRVTSGGRSRDATIQAIGPTQTPSVRTVDGTGTIALPPGDWQLMASADGLGVGRMLLQVPTDGPVPEVLFELRDAQVMVDADAITLRSVLFGLDQATPTPAYDAVLDEVAATIIADPSIIAVEIQGHTDATGGPAYNFQLSRRRANSVLSGLVERGVPADMLTARGFGQTHPLVPNATEQERAQNRRVHFEITKEDGSR